jgi:hypothetical protein
LLFHATNNFANGRLLKYMAMLSADAMRFAYPKLHFQSCILVVREYISLSRFIFFIRLLEAS